MTRNIAALMLTCVFCAAVVCAQTSLEEAMGRAQGLAADSRKAVAAESSARPVLADVPGVREDVRSLAVSVARGCDGAIPRYQLASVSASLGPVLSAAASTLDSSYLYPASSGLSLALRGDGPGAELAIIPANGAAHALGTIAAEAGPCRPYPNASVRLEPAANLAAALSVMPRTGIFRPACYKDPINGFRKLDTWTVLTLSFPVETLTVRVEDSRSFPDERSCREYYARLAAGR